MLLIRLVDRSFLVALGISGGMAILMAIIALIAHGFSRPFIFLAVPMSFVVSCVILIPWVMYNRWQRIELSLTDQGVARLHWNSWSGLHEIDLGNDVKIVRICVFVFRMEWDLGYKYIYTSDDFPEVITSLRESETPCVESL